jgi:pyruvate dehydrogenase E1 component
VSLSASAGPAAAATPEDLRVLRAVERRVLWLATRIVDYANRERPSDDPLKVGGHQASSASMVSLMTALWFWDMTAADRVAVKPHASPVLHACEYLAGRLDRRYLGTLRQLGGLQAYPSRTKDPYPVDYSTGSVGVGAAAPLFDAMAERYVRAHFGGPSEGRFISLIGDAELDEGNLWEAVLEPAGRGLGRVLFIVDLNRQSLDRVVPIIRAREIERQFSAAGWQVIELKWGRRLREAFDGEGGDVLRRRMEDMPNQVYQGLFGASEEVVSEALLEGVEGGERRSLAALLERHRGGVGALTHDLGGHDLGDILGALRAAEVETDRPTVIVAYTVKGYGLPIAGRRLNHSALLNEAQIGALRESVGLAPDTEWDRFPPETPEGALCARAAERLHRPEREPPPSPSVPSAIARRDPKHASTQSFLGSTLVALARVPQVAERLVTASPDVAVSTNLGGWINQVGVFSPREEPASDDGQAIRWDVGPGGRHLELGISEMNLFLLLGQLGLTGPRHGQALLPVGTVYDPFVCRGLDALIHSLYQGARFVICGTPAGITLSREGGAHQSVVTPGIGLGLPSLRYAEPSYAREMEWLLLDGLARLGDPGGESLYLRLSTKPVDQVPFAELARRRGDETLRADVLAGGYWLREPDPGGRGVVMVTCGALAPEALEAGELLAEEGVDAPLLVASSPDLLYRGWRADRERSHLARLVPPALRDRPLVTAIDGASHVLAALGGCLGMRTTALGVEAFGQSGSLPDLYRVFGLAPDQIAVAALDALGDG